MVVVSINIEAALIGIDNSHSTFLSENYIIMVPDTIPAIQSSGCSLEGCEEWYYNVAKRFFGVPNEENNCSQWLGSTNLEGTVYTNRDIVLGTIFKFGNYKFTSRFSFKTESLFVCTESWCDFVFNPEYNLKSIKSLKKELHNSSLVKKLKDMDSQDGYSLEEVILFQQQKIEELYLHVIRLNEELTELEKTR